jgi:hypothetical protein
MPVELMVSTCSHPPLPDHSTDCLFLILDLPNFLYILHRFVWRFTRGFRGRKAVGLVPGECLIPYHPSWPYWLLCSLMEAINSRLDTPSNGWCTKSCSFEIPWSGEPKWTPCPHAPPTSLHVSFPTLPNCSPSIYPSSYTYIYSPPTFYPIPIPAFIFVYHPAPPPYHFAF